MPAQIDFAPCRANLVAGVNTRTNKARRMRVHSQAQTAAMAQAMARMGNAADTISGYKRLPNPAICGMMADLRAGVPHTFHFSGDFVLKRLLAIMAFLFYAAASFAANVDINTASAADLDALKGIGPALSGRILEARKQGPFKDWSDLIARVKGIGNKNAARFSAEGLTVGGASYQGAPAAAQAKTAKPASAAAAAR